MPFLTDLASRLIPYVPGEQPQGGALIKLNTNENPYPPAPGVAPAIASAAARLRLYPDPESTGLCEAFAQNAGLRPAQVFAGNGSDEVLATAFQAFFAGKARLLMPDITYSFYPVYCKLYGVGRVALPVRSDYSIDPADFCVPGDGVVLANPNAPTSLALSREQVERIVAFDPGRVVLVDEAYVDFGAESALPLISRYDNLLVVQTLSKSRALAGLRVGFAAGSPSLIEGMRRVKNSFNSYPLDCLAQAGGTAALSDTAYFDEIRAKIINTRDETAARLREWGFDVPPSRTNFLFVEHPEHAAPDLFAYLRERGILVRYFDAPRLSNRLRISIGTDDEMAALLSVLQGILHGE